MQSDHMDRPAARAADLPVRAEAPAAGRHAPPPWLVAAGRLAAARPSVQGGYRSAGHGLLAPAPAMVERGERLRQRICATPPCARPEQDSFLAHLPEILAGLFDGVAIAFASGPLRSYALRAEALAATVYIATTGRWFATDGTAEGCGLVSLAMWREDVGATAAVLVLRDLTERAGAAALAGDGV